MFQIASQAKIFFSPEPLDFRNGFNGTAATCRQRLEQNPLNGGLFLFINKNKTMARIYFFDGHGEWLVTKRIAQGRFICWSKLSQPREILSEQVYLLLRGGDPRIHLPAPWKKR